MLTMAIYMTALSALLVYVVVLFRSGHWAAGLLGCAVASVPTILVYRESFYYMQIKQRRLGCTFKDWLAWVRGGK
jgi:intracellular multiplication protein IcmV